MSATERKRGFFERLAAIDRRYIFAVMGVAVVLPFLMPLSFHARPSEETCHFDRELERVIAEPAPIMVSLDFGPQTMAELEPIALAVMHKLFKQRKKVIFVTLYPEAAALTRRYLAEMDERYDITYGEDYVFLGYATAFTIAIYNMGSSIEEYFHEDDRGTPLGKLPIMRDVKKLADLSAVVNVASNVMPKHWIAFAVAPFGIDFLMACTAVQATDYYPFLQTGQVKGLLAGGRAGAEYEGMLVAQGVLDAPGDATRGLGSQSLALASIIVFIALGNIGYLAGRRRRGRGAS